MKLIQSLQAEFPHLSFIADFPMSQLTYFKVGGPAEVMVKLQDRDDIIQLVRYCQDHQIKFTVLGGASNVIVSDEGISGLVMMLEHDQLELLGTDEKGGLLRVETGIRTSLLVRKSIDLKLTGLEPFLGVPGRLGGAIYNNSHYTHSLIGDYVARVEVIDEQGEVKWIDRQKCAFAYDDSRFHQTNEIILRVDFKLQAGDPQESKRIIKESTIKRATTQPLNLPSSGCIFKNTPNSDHLRELFPQFSEREFVPTGFLIDQAGLKGEHEGDIYVSQKHAAFFVNKGQGRSSDIMKLLDKVKGVVKKKYQVELEPEVFWLE